MQFKDKVVIVTDDLSWRLRLGVFKIKWSLFNPLIILHYESKT